TIACKQCGPKLRLKLKGKSVRTRSDRETIDRAVELLKLGEPVSVKGVGGFHICSIAKPEAVNMVRASLGRQHKPFALMVKDCGKAREIVHVPTKEAKLLESPQRPVVVLRKRNAEDFLEVSELDSLGIMLPYTALHYLMFDFIDEPLVMTSCNFPGEPVMLNEGIGENSLTHERKIINRCDDSVVKVIGGKELFLRRSRGYAPTPVPLPIDAVDTIAVGAELNNTMCATKRRNCFLSQYVGDTSKAETAGFLRETVKKFVRLTRLKPKIIACDTHPGYYSAMLAKELVKKHKATLVPVQHHKAHVASVAAEHGLMDYAGIAMDGLGFGEDERAWGGEVFSVRGGIRFERVGHLEEQPQLCGDLATIYPKKMLFGILGRFLGENELFKLGLFPRGEAGLYLKALSEGFNVPKTTSSGRVLDAAAALLGFCEKRTYDGRPAMLLEAKATTPYELEPAYILEEDGKILDTTHLFEYLYENLDKDKKRLAATVQMYLARGLLGIAKNMRKPIVFSGGVAYNRMISGHMLENGVLVNRDIPAGDGGICYGQAYLANMLLKNL
ncbi:MAG: carbamoyltransferase HypF, partial [Candidatus Micrarchaeota archaeon]